MACSGIRLVVYACLGLHAMLVPALSLGAQETVVLDDGEDLAAWRAYSGKPLPELSAVAASPAGGKALRCVFHESSTAQFAGRGLQGETGWDQTQGLSFWFNGDGSDGFVAVSLIDDTYTKRYAALVRLKPVGWRQVKLRWDEFVPEVVTADWFGQQAGNMRPALIRALWFGRWFYFKPWSACAFELDAVQLEPALPAPAAAVPEAPGLPRTLARLKARQPVTIVALGDSITYGTHVPDREHKAYPALLQELLRKKFGYDEIKVVNRGVGGIETRQGIALLPRDLGDPAPDLVTAHFGYNDYSTMLEKRIAPGDCAAIARANFEQLVKRVRILSGGKTEVLLVATIPGADEPRHQVLDFFGSQAQAIATDLKCGYSEAPRRVFQAALKAGTLKDYFVRLENGQLDVAHPNAVGQQQFAQALLEAFE